MKYDELAIRSEMKQKNRGGGEGGTDFILERTCLEEHLNLSKSGFVSEEGHSPKKCD